MIRIMASYHFGNHLIVRNQKLQFNILILFAKTYILILRTIYVMQQLFHRTTYVLVMYQTFSCDYWRNDAPLQESEVSYKKY